MRGGFKSLKHPPTKASDIDVEGTREARAAMRAELVACENPYRWSPDAVPQEWVDSLEYQGANRKGANGNIQSDD